MRFSSLRRAAVAALWLGLCAPGAAPAQSWDEIDMVTALFAELQPLSFAKRREYCGFIGYDRAGRLVATAARAGTQASCDLEWTEEIRITASYHTHGAFDPGFVNELPSDIDMRSDRALGVNGWIATPGGRLWHVDSKAMIARQICGVNCLPVAPGFYKSHSGPLAKSYDYPGLLRRLSK